MKNRKTEEQGENMTQKTTPQQPSMKPSDEANAPQLRLAKKQGDAYLEALDYMVTKVAQGQKQAAGNYLVAVAFEEAEGMYHVHDGQLIWRNPTPEENIHIEVAVCDGTDGRFVPGLAVYVTLIQSDGNELGTHQQPFLWHPMLYHYGRNWHIPGDGTYTIRVHIDEPAFMRHDKINGNRYTGPVDVVFPNMQLQTGQKMS
jgi:uncharacterized protein involved in high-affinity Fe2+ transport